MGEFIPQYNDNERFLQDQLKKEVIDDPERGIVHTILSGLLIDDGLQYRKDQKAGCLKLGGEFNSFKLPDVSDEELDNLIDLYKSRIEDITIFLDNHDWDGDTWQPEDYTTLNIFIPQYNDTIIFLQDQLALFKVGRDYHIKLKEMNKKQNRVTPMSQLLQEIAAQTKIISYYNKRIEDITNYIKSNS
jgi:hypothetical protein